MLDQRYSRDFTLHTVPVHKVIPVPRVLSGRIPQMASFRGSQPVRFSIEPYI